jgi:hypothetical protein
MTTTITMLVLNASPALEEDVVDYLLTHPAIEEFSSLTVYGHGSRGDLTVTEQVTGRRKRVQFEILMNEDDVPGITQTLKQRFGTDIRYWQLPVYGLGQS